MCIFIYVCDMYTSHITHRQNMHTVNVCIYIQVYTHRMSEGHTDTDTDTDIDTDTDTDTHSHLHGREIGCVGVLAGSLAFFVQLRVVLHFNPSLHLLKK